MNGTQYNTIKTHHVSSADLLYMVWMRHECYSGVAKPGHTGARALVVPHQPQVRLQIIGTESTFDLPSIPDTLFLGYKPLYVYLVPDHVEIYQRSIAKCTYLQNNEVSYSH